MEEQTSLLQGKRIGLVSCAALEPAITGALMSARVPFASISEHTMDPADPQLDRLDALILGVGAGFSELPWLRPGKLGNRNPPLLLAGSPGAIYCRETLQALADDVILAPFSAGELLFRLYRLTGGKSSIRNALVRKDRPVVLAVDDDLNVTNYLDSVLRNLNVEVHFVSDGQAALKAARQLLPDLMLLDIGLPLMDGLEVLRCLRSDPGTRDLPAVLLTASSDPAHVRYGADLNVLDYVLKPFGHINLARKLKAILRIPPPLPHAPPAV